MSLSIGEKCMYLFFPFMYFSAEQGHDTTGTDYEKWEAGGYKKRKQQYTQYSILGGLFYLLIAFFIANL